MHRRRRVLAMGCSMALLIGVVAPTSARDLEPANADASVVSASRSGQLAETDPALLNRTDSTRLTVMIKLDYDPVASYAGDVNDLAATSPAVTGEPLEANVDAVASYLEHVARVEEEALGAIREAVPSVTVTASFQTVYGGIAASLPADEIDQLLAVESVAAVQQDALEQPLTDSSPELLGAPDAWEELGGAATAGEGVIVGVLDTGIWPEHPSFEDTGAITAPPSPNDGWNCEFGDGGDPDLGDAFECNAKLIGAHAFLDSYMLFVGAGHDEFCSLTTRECSARDPDGHGTHTASTAAGGQLESAPLLGSDRGPVSGVAPGAHLIAYRVCAKLGCFSSDATAAVQQAVLDGVDVLNYSISGGTDPFTHPVELAFLDAYNAGIVVTASAGNEGPEGASANHGGPWVTTAGASTSGRQFLTTLTLAAPGAATLRVEGATVTKGIGATPVVLADSLAGVHRQCLGPLPAGSATGKIVACERGTNVRVLKGHNVAAGGAVGMILYNASAQGLNTDNHFLPAVHIDQPDTDAFLAFVAQPGVTATWGSGVATESPGDVMASFSSRGLVSDFLKPDLVATGVQVLAGHTPDPASRDGGKPGELFQSIQGTSISSAHSAGVAALVMAAHADWTAGQVKSALMTSSVQTVLTDDGEAPATPLDRGAGSIRADRAIATTVTLDVSGAEFAQGAADPLARLHLNLPSIYANPMAGEVTTTRTVTSVSDRAQEITITVEAPPGAHITVSPSRFRLNAGDSRELTIIIRAPSLDEGVYFGQVTLDVDDGNDAVLPVAFARKHGAGGPTDSCTLRRSCD